MNKKYFIALLIIILVIIIYVITILKMSGSMKKLKESNNKLGTLILIIPATMFLLAFASVPLYNLFCKVTGYGGTVQETLYPSEIVIDKEIKVRFNADKEKNLGVYFQPVKRSIVTKLGKTNSIEYKITNNSNKTIEAISIL